MLEFYVQSYTMPFLGVLFPSISKLNASYMEWNLKGANGLLLDCPLVKLLVRLGSLIFSCMGLLGLQ